MKIRYFCDSCGKPIDTIEVAEIDEGRFGFDILTAEERNDLLRYDEAAGCLYVQSLCDACIEAIGLVEDVRPAPVVYH